jgi:MOSC domain-containing protein YiiM
VPRLENIWLKRAHRGPMDPVTSAELVVDRGVHGSANYGGRRQVTIISGERWAEMMEVLQADVDPAARRANLLVSGIDLEQSADRVLQVGTCLLRIGGETRPCERMEEAYPGLQATMRERWGGGAWARVIAGGRIQVGDAVAWSDETSADRRLPSADC